MLSSFRSLSIREWSKYGDKPGGFCQKSRGVVVVRSKAINHLPGGGPDKYHRAVGLFSFILRTRLAYDVSTNLELAS